MKSSRVFLAWISLGWLLMSVPIRSKAAEPTVPAVRAAVERSLPYVVERGQWWIEEKKCVSCHRVSFMTWTLSEAAAAGFELDVEQLAEWRAWSTQALLERPKDKPAVGETNLDGVGQILWAERAIAKDTADSKLQESRAQLVTFLVEHQQADGTWKAGGQLPSQKRPERETHLVSTGWNALALGTELSEKTNATRRKAIESLTVEVDAKSTEWYVVQLLLRLQSGDAEGVARWSGALRELQHPDGGWGWLTESESDALATGQAVYALTEAIKSGGGSATPLMDESLQRAVTFLIDTQQESGSWRVPGTKAKAQGRPVETSNYWGSCWATLALIKVLPE